MELAACQKLVQQLINALPDNALEVLCPDTENPDEDPGVKIFIARSMAAAVLQIKNIYGGEYIEIGERFDGTAMGLFIGEPYELVEGEDQADYPRGGIVLLPRNMPSEEACANVFLHEVGHALGASEDEVAALGLSDDKPLPARPPEVQPPENEAKP